MSQRSEHRETVTIKRVFLSLTNILLGDPNNNAKHDLASRANETRTLGRGSSEAKMA